jgi:site-specific recombinase XerD
MIATIEWIETQLDQAIDGYLQWMAENGYAENTVKGYVHELHRFKLFVEKKKRTLKNSFTHEVLRGFNRVYPTSRGHAIRGLSHYLHEQGKISRHLRMKELIDLPQIYEDYLIYQQKTHQASHRKRMHIRTVLVALHTFLEKHRIGLRTLTIEKIDGFLSEYLANYKEQTCAIYRSRLRGFLRYLFYERKLLSRNLAPLIIGAPQFTKAKPPNFLRSDELQRLFTGLKLSSPSDLRTYAMVHLAYTLGLRPREISLLRLNDIFFKAAELCVRTRKNDAPVRLPVPENTIKAMAAYLVGGRPKSNHRRLFLTLQPPFRPMSQNTVTQAINACMKKTGLPVAAVIFS